MEKLVNNVKKLTGNASGKEKPISLTRSEYSLVSCTELTPGAIELWMELPDEVKNDPYFDNFRKSYEDDRVNQQTIEKKKEKDAKAQQGLPLVKSAPSLNDNIHWLSDDDSSQDGAKDVGGVAVLPEVENSTKGIENVELPKKETQMARARYYVKISVLLACWLFFTAVFILYNEKEEIVKHSSVAAGEVKNYPVHSHEGILRMRLKLTGPFLTVQAERHLNLSELEGRPKMEVWLERWTLDRAHQTEDMINIDSVVYRQETESWKIMLQDEKLIDFTEGETRIHEIELKTNITPDSNHTSVYVVRMMTTSNRTTPFTISYMKNPLDVATGVIYGCILLCGLYSMIIFEVMNRTMAAILVSMTALAVLSMVGERPSVPEIISWLDIETLLLLFSMMILVAIMAETGMFDFMAVFTFEVTKGKMWPLINVLCVITAVVSTFLDNVTTILLMAPITIRLCEVMYLDPKAILMTMVLFSNLGGTATPVGDPPNVILASNKDIKQAGINFTNFTLHMTLGILLVSVQTYFQLRFTYRDTNKLRLSVPKDVQNLRQQLAIWRRAAASLPHCSQDEHIVRQALERKVLKLQKQLDERIRDTTKRACPKETFQSTLTELKGKYKIRDKPLLLKASLSIAFAVTLFFLHSLPELQTLSLGWTALLGAVLVLILADREDLEPILHRVEWSTLMFFAALFVLMEALSKLGLIESIGGVTESIIMSVDESNRLMVALMLLVWVSGVTSAFVDNVPLTTMMVRVVTSLGTNPDLGLPMGPLVWALSFGVCLGGNGTVIGASANVVCAGVAEQHGYKITFIEYFKIGKRRGAADSGQVRGTIPLVKERFGNMISACISNINTSNTM